MPDGIVGAIRAELDRRSWWMNLMFGFCLYMTFIYMPFDILIKPVEQDAEVWFGYMFRGWAAKATGLVHWAVYGAGAYGFWRMKHWMWPWAAAYCAQVVFAMAVWNLTVGGGLIPAAISAAVFAVPTIALWRSRARFAPV